MEITQEGLRQVQVRPGIGLDFARAMRAFLRADPDVIMVGEMRDRETAAIGIEASLTGHLVFSTLHTNSAAETIVRLLDMGMDPFNFADALIGILAQRLVRKLCRQCRKAYQPRPEELAHLLRVYGEVSGAGDSPGEAPPVLFRPEGCAGCGRTGFRGRTGLHELLEVTAGMKTMIQEGATAERLRTRAVQDGMTTLLQDGIRKVLSGLTDLKQVRRVCMR